MKYREKPVEVGLNPLLKMLWVDDLRAGHPQTRHQLKDQYGHCVIGRLCEVAVSNDMVPAGADIDIRSDRIFAGGHTDGFDNDTIARFGFVSLEQFFVLVNMNDSDQSFNQIADWIEAHL